MKIEARGLHMRLGSREVLRGLDFVAHTGEMTAVIGPNGAGKTTLLKALAGLLTPSAGAVTLDGRAMADWPPQVRARSRQVGRSQNPNATRWVLPRRRLR